jgi:DNA-binding transcriptional LysR family regulator
MPLSRAFILPDAIAKFHRTHPGVLIRVTEGPYDTLLFGLRRGEIDFLFGAMRHHLPVEDVIQDILFDDELVIVAGPDHPLAKRADPVFADTVGYPWVVTAPGTPARRQFDEFFARHAATPPDSVVETSSMILMRELLRAGPYLGCISRLQVKGELDKGLLELLPFELDNSRREIGITTRVGWKPTRTQSDFLELVRADFERPQAAG